MSTAIATKPAASLDIVATAVTSAQLKGQIQLIQRVMSDVMIEGVHYGRIPGTPKPSLWKPGAEVLCATFRIAPHYRVEDLSAGDVLRYRVTCLGKSQASGVELGEGVGECSSAEAKYAWRAPVCDEEFQATDENRRRLKWFKGRDGKKPYAEKQIRTDAADSANTVLKMAAKRAHVAMVLNVLAASDIFSQDLEDIDADGNTNSSDHASSSGARRPAAKQPNRLTNPPQSNGGDGKLTDGQRKLIFAKLNAAGMSAEDLCKHFGIESVPELPFSKVNEALAFIADPERGAIRQEGDEAKP